MIKLTIAHLSWRPRPFPPRPHSGLLPQDVGRRLALQTSSGLHLSSLGRRVVSPRLTDNTKLCCAPGWLVSGGNSGGGGGGAFLNQLHREQLHIC